MNKLTHNIILIAPWWHIRLSPKSKCHISTWNVRTMFKTRKTAQVEREMLLYRISILDISECRWDWQWLCDNITGQHNELVKLNQIHWLISFTWEFPDSSVAQRNLDCINQRRKCVRQSWLALYACVYLSRHALSNSSQSR